MSDSIGPASVRSDAYYLLAELFERAELEELLDAQTGVLLGIALSDLLREGWTILAPPPKADVPKPFLSVAVERVMTSPEYADVATELRRVFKRRLA